MKKSPSELNRLEEIKAARLQLQSFLDQIHVMDTLVDRTTVLNIDSNLKMHSVIG